MNLILIFCFIISFYFISTISIVSHFDYYNSICLNTFIKPYFQHCLALAKSLDILVFYYLITNLLYVSHFFNYYELYIIDARFIVACGSSVCGGWFSIYYFIINQFFTFLCFLLRLIKSVCKSELRYITDFLLNLPLSHLFIFE